MLTTWKQPPLKSTSGVLFDVINYPLGNIVFTLSAVKKLKPYIETEVEFLPIHLPDFQGCLWSMSLMLLIVLMLKK